MSGTVTGKVVFLHRPVEPQRLFLWDNGRQAVYLYPDMTIRHGELRHRIRLGRTYEVTATGEQLTVRRMKRPFLCRLGIHVGAGWTSGANYWWCARCETSPKWDRPY